jgi:hypothetical protein
MGRLIGLTPAVGIRPTGGTTTLRLRSVQGYSFLTSRSFTNEHTYDEASNRTGFTDPEGGSTAYGYDTSLLAG